MKMKSLPNTLRHVRITSLLAFLGLIGTTTHAGEYRVEGDMTVTENLGIGTNAPSAELDVAGNAKVDGSLETKTLSVEGYKVESLTHTYTYAPPKPPEFIPLGVFHSSDSVRIIARDEGYDMGGGVEFYIA